MHSVRRSLRLKATSADLGASVFSSYLGDDADNPRLEVNDGAAYRTTSLTPTEINEAGVGRW